MWYQALLCGCLMSKDDFLAVQYLAFVNTHFTYSALILPVSQQLSCVNELQLIVCYLCILPLQKGQHLLVMSSPYQTALQLTGETWWLLSGPYVGWTCAQFLPICYIFSSLSHILISFGTCSFSPGLP